MMVKGRNEPVAIIHVAHVIASVKGISVEKVCEAYVWKAISQVHEYLLTVLFSAWQNSIRMFGLGEEA